MVDSKVEETKISIVDGVRTLVLQTATFRSKLSTALGHLESGQIDQIHVMRRTRLIAVVARPEKSDKDLLPVGSIEL